MIQDVKAEDEMDVVAPGIGNLFNPAGTLAARIGVPQYTFFDAAGPSAPPQATTRNRLLCPRHAQRPLFA
jgi:hypothetical protein